MIEHERAREVILGARDVPVIVNLGAYHGEDDKEFALTGRPFQHIMVEADPANAVLIRSRLPGRTVLTAAIAEVSGELIFWRSHDSRDGATGSGSILRPTGHLKHFPTISFGELIIVPTLSLDDMFDSLSLTRIDLLWVDIQGAEAQMIRGGQKALRHTRYLMIEAEEVEFYEGQVLKPDLLGMLPHWDVVQDFGFNVFLVNREQNDD
jgi:FkbM family methyltransferase